MFALSPKPSYLKTSNLCTRVQIFHQNNICFRKFRVGQFLAPRPEYPPPWAEYPGGRIIRPQGRIIRPECRPGIYRGRVGLPPGSSNPNPLALSCRRRRRLSAAATGAPATPLAGFRRRLLFSTSGGYSPSRFRNGCGYFSIPRM
jgi:hypothetical protein